MLIQSKSFISSGSCARRAAWAFGLRPPTAPNYTYNLKKGQAGHPELVIMAPTGLKKAYTALCNAAGPATAAAIVAALAVREERIYG